VAELVVCPLNYTLARDYANFYVRDLQQYCDFNISWSRMPLRVRVLVPKHSMYRVTIESVELQWTTTVVYIMY
jgi:hypothetical protein